MSDSTRLSAAILVVAISGPVLSQPSAPTFEVASVKTVHETRTWALRQVNPQRYRSVSNVTQMLTWAWKVKNFQILGAPAWLSQERFEIQATTGRPSNVDQVRSMVQGLLADRFKLKLHRENKEIPVYALVVGKNGPKLAPAKDASQSGNRGINIASGVLVARDGTMDDFVDVLTTNLDRPVLDKTNLAGRYDFSLTWDQPSVPATETSWTPIGPAIFAPIHDLGLSLEAQKAFVEMLVIDSVDHPSEN